MPGYQNVCATFTQLQRQSVAFGYLWKTISKWSTSYLSSYLNWNSTFIVHTCIGKYLSILLIKSCCAPSPSKMGIIRSLVLAHILQRCIHVNVTSVWCLWDIVSSMFPSGYCTAWSCDIRKKSSSVPSASLRPSCDTILFTVSIRIMSSPEESIPGGIELLDSMLMKKMTTCSTRDQRKFVE